MLTQVNNAVVVEPTNVFGSGVAQNSEIAVLADNGENAGLLAPRGPILVRSFDNTLPHEYRLGDFNPERIILNDPVSRDAAGGPAGALPANAQVRDRFDGAILAVVDYSFGNYKFLVRQFPALQDGGLTPATAERADKHDLSVASYNVENLDPVNDAARIEAIALQIKDNLRAPDILGVQEMQDFDGEGPGGPAGDPTFAALVDAIAAAGGPDYEYRQIDPVHNEDGGAPNANIRVGFLFRPDRVTFVDRPGGTALTATEDDPAQPGAQLTFSPGRIDPGNPVWDASRKPLAGEFVFEGRKLFVVANHFASKGGDAPLFGRFQEPYRPSELQRRGATQPTLDPQRGQAGVVNAWVERLLAADKHARVVVLGDLNDFEFSEMANVLERGAPGSEPELTDLWQLLPTSEHYSYIFQGSGQVLDHILASRALLAPRPDFGPIHMNAEFDEEQQSDHDPPLARFRVTGEK
jgi:predicted extracellular nuclease